MKKIVLLALALLSFTFSSFAHVTSDSFISDYKGREENVEPDSWVYFAALNNPSLAAPYIGDVSRNQYFVLKAIGVNEKTMKEKIERLPPNKILAKALTKVVLSTDAFEGDIKKKAQLEDSFSTILKDIKVLDSSWIKIESKTEEHYEYYILYTLNKRTFKEGCDTLLVNVFSNDFQKDDTLKRILRQNLIFCPLLSE